MTEHHSHQRRYLEDCVVAAIEAGEKLRRPHENGPQTDPVEHTIAMVESEAARLRGNDFSALNAVLGSQALALDTIFTQLLRKAVDQNVLGRDVLRLALKAQSQSRATFNSLVSVARPRAAQPPRRTIKFGDQTDANGNNLSR